jgi:hypothetical protein
MAGKMTLLYVKETRHILAFASRTAVPKTIEGYSGLGDDDKKQVREDELDRVAGAELVIANNLRPTDPQVDLRIPKNALDVGFCDIDPQLMNAPRRFVLDAEDKPVAVGGQISNVALAAAGRDQITVSVSPAVASGEAKLWARIQPEDPGGDPQTVTGKLVPSVNGGASATLPISALPSGDYAALVLVAGYPAKFTKL